MAGYVECTTSLQAHERENMKIHAWHFLYDTGLMRDGRKPAKIETFGSGSI